MRYIRVDPRSLEVVVGFKPGEPGLSVPLPPRARPRPTTGHPLAHVILHEVLYPARTARDHAKGVAGVRYKLPHPDPWLVAIGLVMWEGILQGLAWDVVKTMVADGLARLRVAGVAPPANSKLSIRRELSLGLHYSEYCSAKGQRELFFGLRSVHKKRGLSDTPAPRHSNAHASPSKRKRKTK